MLVPVDLSESKVLWEANVPVPFVYFPRNGYVSLMSVPSSEVGVELSMVGREGVVGAALALGPHRSPWRAVVIGAGLAWRLEASWLQAELMRSASLKRLLHRYVQVQLAQLGLAAGCLHSHRLPSRLARRLLMCDDRSSHAPFRATHESLALALGVRRVGVTTAAGKLQRDGIISYRRGELAVLDRSRLKVEACSCYDNDQRAYTEILAG